MKTNVLCFAKGKPTEKIWYYDLSDVKVAKKTPFTRPQLAEFFKLLPTSADSDRSWTLDIAPAAADPRKKPMPSGQLPANSIHG